MAEIKLNHFFYRHNVKTAKHGTHLASMLNAQMLYGFSFFQQGIYLVGSLINKILLRERRVEFGQNNNNEANASLLRGVLDGMYELSPRLAEAKDMKSKTTSTQADCLSSAAGREKQLLKDLEEVFQQAETGVLQNAARLFCFLLTHCIICIILINTKR